jgi:hypothetical protein
MSRRVLLILHPFTFHDSLHILFDVLQTCVVETVSLKLQQHQANYVCDSITDRNSQSSARQLQTQSVAANSALYTR